MTPTIRPASAADIPALLDLLGQVLKIHNEGRPDIFRTPSEGHPIVKYTVGELETMLKDDRRVILAAETGGRVCGYAFCELKRLESDNIFTPILTMYIDDICVDASARGEHVGTALYKAVKDIARSHGCHNITLRVWEFNGPAVSFYEKMGMGTQARIMEEIL